MGTVKFYETKKDLKMLIRKVRWKAANILINRILFKKEENCHPT